MFRNLRSKIFSATLVAVVGAALVLPSTGLSFEESWGTITPTETGTEQAVSFPSPGLSARYDVPVTVGESVSLESSATALSSDYRLDWLSPNGENIRTWHPEGGVDRFFEPVRFTEAGSATLVVTPEGGGTGSVTFTAFDASDRTGSITPTEEGASGSFAIGAPGQRNLISFDGVRGDEVTITPSEASFEGEFHVDAPGGERLEASGGDLSTAHGPVTLPHVGTYTIVLTGDGAQTGSVKLNATSATPDGIEGGTVAETGSTTSKCTDVWVGPATGGLWQEVEEWSMETVPSSADVACIPTGKTIGIESGQRSASVLQGGGTLRMSGGTLTLSSESHDSNVGSLEMEGGMIDGPATLRIVSVLEASNGTFAGSGHTYLGADAVGRVEGSGPASGLALRDLQSHVFTVRGELHLEGEEPHLAIGEGAELQNAGRILEAGEGSRISLTEDATLVNQGPVEGGGRIEVTDSSGALTAGDGGKIENSGTVLIDSEDEGEGISGIPGGTAPVFVNFGKLVKATGEGVAPVGLPFDNRGGTVLARAGTLSFEGGGDAGGEGGDWLAEPEDEESESAIAFEGEEFDLGPESRLTGEIEVGSAAEVEAGAIEAGEAWITVEEAGLDLAAANGSSSIAGLTVESEGNVRSHGELHVSSVNEHGGKIDLRPSTVSTLNFVQQTGGLLTAGDGTQLTMGTSFIYGSLEMGDDVTATFSSSLFEEGGSVTEVGDRATLDFESAYLYAGATLSIGEDGSLSYDHLYDQMAGGGAGAPAIFGAGTDVSVTEGAYLTGGRSVEFGGSSSLVADVLVIGDDLRMGADATVQSRSLSIESGANVSTGSGATLEVSEILFDSGSVEVGENSSVASPAGYIQNPEQQLSAGDGSELEFDRLYLEGTTSLEGESRLQAGELYFDGDSGSGAITGAGEVDARFLVWSGASFSGSGTLSIGEAGFVSSASHSESEPAEPVVLDGWTVVNHGELSFDDGLLEMSEDALIRNLGTFDVNSEEESAHGGQIFLRPAPRIRPFLTHQEGYGVENRGRVEKTKGNGTTTIDVDTKNHGQMGQKSGKLKINRPVTRASSEHTGARCHSGDPVDCATGDLVESQTDLSIGGLGLGLEVTRSYSAQAAAGAAEPGPFGWGWTGSYSDHLLIEGGEGRVTFVNSAGETVPFEEEVGGTFGAPSWSKDGLAESPGGGYELTLPGGEVENFSAEGKPTALIDRNGNETSLIYDGAGHLEEVTDPSGRSLTFSYDPEGQVEAVEDPMGGTVHYGYEDGDLVRVTLPGESTPRWQFDYDGEHRLVELENGLGGTTVNEYDAESRVVSQTDPVGSTLTFDYTGLHTIITNEATGSVTEEWFTSDNEPSRIIHAAGTPEETTEFVNYNEAGLLAERIDGNGHATTYGYDSEGNRTSERNAEGDETTWTFNGAHEALSATSPGDEETTIVRDPNGNPETISRPAPGGETQTVAYEYGPHGEVESMTDPLGHTWTYGYGAHGDRIAETNPEGDERTWAYDEDSQVISTVGPRGNEVSAEAGEFTTTIERDARGRPLKITDPLGGATEYAYDGDGNLESTTDPNGHTTAFRYDAGDRRTELERPDGSVEKTTYDGAGQVATQTDGNEDETVYVRNALEEPIETADPLGRTTTRTFDAAGNLETKTDPEGRTTTFAYDAADRLEAISYSSEVGRDASFGYDEDGDLVSMVDPTGESTYEYDQLDRLVHSENGNGEAVSWEYNLDDEPVGLTYPNGKSISRSYDTAGRLEGVTDWLGHTTSFAYNPDSEPTATTFPAGTGDADEYVYDRADRMNAVTMQKGPETLASLAYTRDPAGQIESLVSEGLPGAEEETFAYDANERLIEAGAAAFGYDAADNLTKAPGTTNAFDDASQLESATGAAFTYDEEGERTTVTLASGPATDYGYDQAGRLTSIERSEEGEVPAIAESFDYDGLGVLASRTVGPTTRHLVWDPTAPPEPLLSDGADSYIYGPGGLPVEQISESEVPTYLHHDQLGSTRLLTDAEGKTSATFSYTPYGTVAAKTGTASTPLGFAGQYTLDQSGLQYLRARFYDPATGQFMTRDPIEEATREPYAYAGDDPANLRDPSGLISIGGILEDAPGIPCPWCAAAARVAEGLEGGVESGLGAAEWLLTNSLGFERLDEGDDVPCGPDRNWRQDKKVTERELKDAGLDAHELKELGSGSDIYKDREGNLYEKPKGGKGPGEPLGINIKDLTR